MIQLTERDLVDKAVLQKESPLDVSGPLSSMVSGRHVPVTLREASMLLDSMDVPGEDIPCVWDVLPPQEGHAALSFFPHQELVLVYQAWSASDSRTDGIPWFAVLRSVFERGILRSQKNPFISEKKAIAIFLEELFPRIILRKGGWQKDGTCLWYSNPLSTALAKLFAVDMADVLQAVANKLSLSQNVSGVEISREGILFDTTLEAVCEKIALNVSFIRGCEVR